jgi:hypothetical protein
MIKMSTPNLTAIVAATKSNGIGLNGGLPWRLPGEMKYFAKGKSAGQRPTNLHQRRHDRISQLLPKVVVTSRGVLDLHEVEECRGNEEEPGLMLE